MTRFQVLLALLLTGAVANGSMITDLQEIGVTPAATSALLGHVEIVTNPELSGIDLFSVDDSPVEGERPTWSYDPETGRVVVHAGEVFGPRRSGGWQTRYEPVSVAIHGNASDRRQLSTEELRELIAQIRLLSGTSTLTLQDFHVSRDWLPPATSLSGQIAYQRTGREAVSPTGMAVVEFAQVLRPGLEASDLGFGLSLWDGELVLPSDTAWPDVLVSVGYRRLIPQRLDSLVALTGPASGGYLLVAEPIFIPEPTSVMLLAMASLGFQRRR